MMPPRKAWLLSLIVMVIAVFVAKWSLVKSVAVVTAFTFLGYWLRLLVDKWDAYEMRKDRERDNG